MPPETPPIGTGTVPIQPAPAGTLPVTPGVAAVPPQPGETLESLYARLAAAETARQQSDTRYANAQRTIGQQGRELSEYRRAYYGQQGQPPGNGGAAANLGAPDTGYGYDQPVGGAAPGATGYRSPLVGDPVYEQGRKRTEIMEFRINNPHLTPQSWQRLVAYATSPVNEAGVTVYNEYGQVDFSRSYQFALNQLELADFHAARASAAGVGAPGIAVQGLPYAPGQPVPVAQPVYPGMVPGAAQPVPMAAHPVYAPPESPIPGYVPGVVPYPPAPAAAPPAVAQPYPGLPAYPVQPSVQAAPAGYAQPAWMYGSPTQAPVYGGYPPAQAGPPMGAGALSGGGGVVGPEPFDIRNATAAEILVKGGLAYDPADPPAAMRR